MNRGETIECVCKQTLVEGRERDEVAAVFGMSAPLEAKHPKGGAVGEKAGARCKADVVVDPWHVSIKAVGVAPPAILNHTPRTAKVWGSRFSSELSSLDATLGRYLVKRRAGEAGEDQLLESLVEGEGERVDWLRVLAYFVFQGTGQGPSEVEANSILEVENPCEVSTWRFVPCLDEGEKMQYIEEVFPRLVVSLRSKGIPKRVAEADLEPWCYRDVKKNGEVCLKAALHIRVRK